MWGVVDDTVLAELGELNETKHLNIWHHAWYLVDFPSGLEGKESTCNAGGAPQGFDSWVRKIPWRREWQPTPVFLPGESHRQRSLVGCSHGVTKCQTWLKYFHFSIWQTINGAVRITIPGIRMTIFIHNGPSNDGNWDVESLWAELNKLSFDATKNTRSIFSLCRSVSSLMGH